MKRRRLTSSPKSAPRPDVVCFDSSSYVFLFFTHSLTSGCFLLLTQLGKIFIRSETIILAGSSPSQRRHSSLYVWDFPSSLNPALTVVVELFTTNTPSSPWYTHCSYNHTSCRMLLAPVVVAAAPPYSSSSGASGRGKSPPQNFITSPPSSAAPRMPTEAKTHKFKVLESLPSRCCCCGIDRDQNPNINTSLYRISHRLPPPDRYFRHDEAN